MSPYYGTLKFFPTRKIILSHYFFGGQWNKIYQSNIALSSPSTVLGLNIFIFWIPSIAQMYKKAIRISIAYHPLKTYFQNSAVPHICHIVVFPRGGGIPTYFQNSALPNKCHTVLFHEGAGGSQPIFKIVLFTICHIVLFPRGGGGSQPIFKIVLFPTLL